MSLLTIFPAIRLEWDRSGLFMRLGRRELYARRYPDASPSWAWVRHDDGDREVTAGRFRLTVSRVPMPVSPIA